MSLLDAATKADEHALRAAMHAGADVNALDAAGRSALACAIGGESWQTADASDASFKLQARLSILRTLLSDHDLSLYVANVPAQGVTPLGLAAWLDLPDFVRVLCEESRGIVAIDGMDTHGATPLMYAARDGRREVVSVLLQNGARPDIRDVHHRTSIQHALRHPPVLWLCESALRRHRMREHAARNRRRLTPLPDEYRNHLQASCSSDSFSLTSIPHCSRAHIEQSTASLVAAIVANDLPALHSLIFPAPSVAQPAILVNSPDLEGFSPLHYCVLAEQPSIVVLDALYRAGADMSLYSVIGQGTVLHCLARRTFKTADEASSTSLHSFVHHLVRDLHAPLSARDDDQETCLHVAAEHGHSLDIVLAFLDCDINGAVRQMRNSRGLTALEVSKPEFRAAFGLTVENLRSESSASVRTVRPSTASGSSLKSMSSVMSITSATFVPRPSSDRRAQNQDGPESDNSPSVYSTQIFANLRRATRELEDEANVQENDVRHLLEETSCLSQDLFDSLRSRIRDVAEDLRDARGMFKQVDGLLERVTHTMEDKFGEPMTQDTRGRDSGDSEATAVSQRDISCFNKQDDFAVAASLPAIVEPPPSLVADSSGSEPHTADLVHEEGRLMKFISPWIKELPRKKSKGDLKSNASEYYKLSASLSAELDKRDLGSAKLKVWFLKKLRPDVVPEAAKDIDEALSTAGKDDRVSHSPRIVKVHNDESPAGPSRSKSCAIARRVLSAASKDLSRIDDCMDIAEQFIALASHSATQAERRLTMTILNRMATLQCVRVTQLKIRLEGSDPFLSDQQHDTIKFPSAPLPSNPDSFTKPKQTASPTSSVLSFSSTLVEPDDDTRALRRLLTRKIEARMDGAIDEIDKVMTWLPIVRDTLRNLDRRTRTPAQG